MKRTANDILQHWALSGKVWISLWSVVALVRFALDKHIDPVFLGVLGAYTVHTVGAKFADSTNSSEEK